jgi:hypothetical protein
VGAKCGKEEQRDGWDNQVEGDHMSALSLYEVRRALTRRSCP